jgi:tetratricopeptide (TPR) repeat protein
MLVTVLMVKNEEKSIEATLKPFLEAGVSQYLILDTGSEDNTVLSTDQLLKNAGVCYHVFQEEFIDFASSRNRALALAEQMYPKSSFLIMPDAEWILHNASELVLFCQQEMHTDTPLYLIKIHMEDLAFYSARLFRTAAHIRFTGAVHEVPSLIAVHKIPEQVCFEFKSSQQGRENSKARWTRDLALLLKEYQQDELDPNPRTVFYLAQTYECLELLDEASFFYGLRATLKGYDEETYTAVLRLGLIAEHRSKLSTALFPWETAERYYHQAFRMRPHRIEPLVRIADHYWPDNIPLCYVYAKYACEMPYPHEDILFVDKCVYDYQRFEILSRCAWYLQNYAAGLDATKKALGIKPNTPHLLNNLMLYENKILDLTNSLLPS